MRLPVFLLPPPRQSTTGEDDKTTSVLCSLCKAGWQVQTGAITSHLCVRRENRGLRVNKVRLLRRIAGCISTNESAANEEAEMHRSFCLLKSGLGRCITTTDRLAILVDMIRR